MNVAVILWNQLKRVISEILCLMMAVRYHRIISTKDRKKINGKVSA